MAWKCQQPMIVALLPMGNPGSQALEAKALKERNFLKDFVPRNCVLLLWRLKPGKAEAPEPGARRRGGPPPQAKSIDVRPIKADEAKFLTAFAVSPEAKAAAARNGGAAPKFSEMRHYPAVICVDASASQLLFRAPAFKIEKDIRASFGTWISQIVDLMKSKGVEPELSPSLTKICDNPTEPKKWK